MESGFGSCLKSVPIKRLPGGFEKIITNQLKLVYFKRDASIGEIPMHAIPLKKKGKIDFKRKNLIRFEPHDIIRFDMSKLQVASRGDREIKVPGCTIKRGYELKFGGKSFFLIECIEKQQGALEGLVRYSKKDRRIMTPFYNYQYDEDNHLLLDWMKFKENDLNLLEDTKLLIHADFRNFFTLNFDSTNVESLLKDYRTTSQGIEAEVAFYLRLLFFRLKLTLMTDVYFYKDKISIPMVMFLPKNAFDYVNDDSAILYYWKALKSSELNNLNMPFFDADYLRSNKDKVTEKVFRKYCQADCRFKFTMTNGGRNVDFNFLIPRYLVRKGFYPIYFADRSPLVEFEQEKRIDDMKVKVPLEIESSDKYRREGVMFKYKNLEKGEHRWTFEINFSNRQQDDCKGDDLRIIKKL